MNDRAKKKSILVYSLVTLSIFACAPKKINDIKIIPLHPYVDSLPPEATNNKLGKDYGVSYFFVRGESSLKDPVSAKIDSFVLQYFQDNKSRIAQFDRYEIRVFKETKVLNEKFREKIDGLYGDILDYHLNDLLLVYIWRLGDKFEKQYYSNGEVAAPLK
ncbi:hypothetical protein LZZ85_24385 [Terrimonas sp. NA20]|uniref:Lipoprotein n=1 Tax=Terrimonas ginsenosidimutans TaxID=2908004 RepID=A0ABS9KYK0_9BACT|nr:hypothetical protein [Terrimonas ginsenosidimutans]MCG2617459.1 hypothetical protein [Terrimonas ginsenosidimutans]